VGEMVPTEIPGPGFPGQSAQLSHMAWPISHRQPGRYDTWPQLGYGTPNRTFLPCWKRILIKDHERGWPGLCTKLMNAKKYQSEEGCRSFCWNEPRCAVWQYVNHSNPGECWVGFGEHCSSQQGRATPITVQGAQRIMHGSVRVLKNLAGWKINHLYSLGMFKSGDEQVSINRCKAWCYSDISCQYWQWGPGGCWVDAPRWSRAEGNNANNAVQYPLTTAGGASNTSSDALTMLWGEYIQHYCPPQHTTPPPMRAAPVPAPQLPLLVQPTAAPSSSIWSEWWLWCLMALAICLCGGACAYAIMTGMGQGEKRSQKAKRNGRIAMSEYGDEDSPMLSPPKRRPSSIDDNIPAPPPAPTMDYLNADRPQDYQQQQWQQQQQQQAQGAMDASGRRQSNLMHAPPETMRAMPYQGAAPPTQPVDSVRPPPSMPYQGGGPAQNYGQYNQYQQGGMPFPSAGGHRHGVQTMQGMQSMPPPTGRLM